jgi:hypothetical protein
VDGAGGVHNAFHGRELHGVIQASALERTLRVIPHWYTTHKLGKSCIILLGILHKRVPTADNA